MACAVAMATAVRAPEIWPSESARVPPSVCATTEQERGAYEFEADAHEEQHRDHQRGDVRSDIQIHRDEHAVRNSPSALSCVCRARVLVVGNRLTSDHAVYEPTELEPGFGPVF